MNMDLIDFVDCFFGHLSSFLRISILKDKLLGKVLAVQVRKPVFNCL